MPKRIVKHRYFAEVIDTYVVETDESRPSRSDDELRAYPRGFIYSLEPRERIIEQDHDYDDDIVIENMGVLEELVEAVEEDDAEVR